MKRICFVGILAACWAAAVQPSALQTVVMKQSTKETVRAEQVEIFTLSNNMMNLTISSLGASITSVFVPDVQGKMGDVVLGYQSHELDAQMKGNPYFGCIVGRVANRIANGRFTLDGKEYVLDRNNGPNHLHGGNEGFDKRVWNVSKVLPDGIQLTLRSPDGDQGYPGNVDVTAEYRLVDSSIELHITARSDAPTPINLAQHSYFNLCGHSDTTDSTAMSVLGHEVLIAADAYTPVDDTSIPTGELAPVDGSEFDFRRPTVLGDRIAALARRTGYPDATYDPSARALLGASADSAPPGFDHNFAVTGGCAAPSAAAAAAAAAAATPPPLRLVATVRDPVSGRALTVESDAPGVQFYTGNFLGPATAGKPALGYPRHAGLCLETQHFPDTAGDGWRRGRAAAAALEAGAAPVLRPGGVYSHRVAFRFSATAA